MISHNYGMADIEIMYPELVTRTVQKNRKKKMKSTFSKTIICIMNWKIVTYIYE